MENAFFWFYCLTLTVAYATFVILIAIFNFTSFFIGSISDATMPIAYFQSFMALWAYVLIPACVLLMWWTYSRRQYALTFLFSSLPILIIFFTSKLFVTWGTVAT